jgi:cardiolipin synthase
MDVGYLRRLRDAGVEVEQFHPLRWYTLTRLKNRTHRKLLVVDGRIGFTGGVGIADLWQGDADSKEHWRDSHFRIEGPAVAQMQAAFTDNWIRTRGEVLCGSKYFPELRPVGDSLAQVFRSSRGEGSESVRLMYLLSITAAVRNIRLQSAYFVPDELAIAAFVTARQRGVKVELIVPGPHMDAKVVQSASRAQWGGLLDAGVEIREFQPTMYHCKVLAGNCRRWGIAGRQCRIRCASDSSRYCQLIAATTGLCSGCQHDIRRGSRTDKCGDRWPHGQRPGSGYKIDYIICRVAR